MNHLSQPPEEKTGRSGGAGPRPARVAADADNARPEWRFSGRRGNPIDLRSQQPGNLPPEMQRSLQHIAKERHTVKTARGASGAGAAAARQAPGGSPTVASQAPPVSAAPIPAERRAPAPAPVNVTPAHVIPAPLHEHPPVPDLTGAEPIMAPEATTSISAATYSAPPTPQLGATTGDTMQVEPEATPPVSQDEGVVPRPEGTRPRRPMTEAERKKRAKMRQKMKKEREKQRVKEAKLQTKKGHAPDATPAQSPAPATATAPQAAGQAGAATAPSEGSGGGFSLKRLLVGDRSAKAQPETMDSVAVPEPFLIPAPAQPATPATIPTPALAQPPAEPAAILPVAPEVHAAALAPVVTPAAGTEPAPAPIAEPAPAPIAEPVAAPVAKAAPVPEPQLPEAVTSAPEAAPAEVVPEWSAERPPAPATPVAVAADVVPTAVVAPPTEPAFAPAETSRRPAAVNTTPTAPEPPAPAASPQPAREPAAVGAPKAPARPAAAADTRDREREVRARIEAKRQQLQDMFADLGTPNR